MLTQTAQLRPPSVCVPTIFNRPSWPIGNEQPTHAKCALWRLIIAFKIAEAQQEAQSMHQSQTKANQEKSSSTVWYSGCCVKTGARRSAEPTTTRTFKTSSIRQEIERAASSQSIRKLSRRSEQIAQLISKQIKQLMREGTWSLNSNQDRSWRKSR